MIFPFHLKFRGWTVAYTERFFVINRLENGLGVDYGLKAERNWCMIQMFKWELGLATIFKFSPWIYYPPTSVECSPWIYCPHDDSQLLSFSPFVKLCNTRTGNNYPISVEATQLMTVILQPLGLEFSMNLFVIRNIRKNLDSSEGCQVLTNHSISKALVSYWKDSMSDRKRLFTLCEYRDSQGVYFRSLFCFLLEKGTCDVFSF